MKSPHENAPGVATIFDRTRDISIRLLRHLRGKIKVRIFLWENKPDKVCREDAKLSEKAGGLGILDVNSFWKSLKFSWLRRALNTTAFWPKILCLSVKRIEGYERTISELLQEGPIHLSNIGKKMSNKFWKEVFCTINLFMQGALFCYPDKILTAPIWDNPSILQNNKAVKIILDNHTAG